MAEAACLAPATMIRERIAPFFLVTCFRSSAGRIMSFTPPEADLRLNEIYPICLYVV